MIAGSGPGQPLDGEFRARFAASAALSERAAAVLAGAAAHDSWMLDPFPVAMERGEGPWKWDVDGNRMVDYWMGHGALLFGHGFAPVCEAVRRQGAIGCHLGPVHDAQVRWAEAIGRGIPSAERVRFTASGTEATMLAARVARAYTGRPMILKFNGHFHGWHDEALSRYVDECTAGIGPGVGQGCQVVYAEHPDHVHEMLESHEIAAVLLEPGGGSSGSLPYDRGLLADLRQATSANGTLLVFDEVVSGFRASPGGVQALAGVTPDLTALAKIMAGGLPGAALVGSAGVMRVFGAGAAIGERLVQVPHTGTFNGNALSAAAGVAMLEHAADGTAQVRAHRAAHRLVAAVNRAAEAADIDVRLHAHHAVFHIVIGAQGAGIQPTASHPALCLSARMGEAHARLRRALLLEGVDCHPIHGWVSAVHDEAVIDASANGFARAFQRLLRDPGFQASLPPAG